MANSILSQEILDKIVDWVAFIQSRDTSFRALRNLSLASRSFTPRCRHHTFRRVDLATASADWTVVQARKLETILRHPQLAEYVSVLYFKESAYPHPAYTDRVDSQLTQAIRSLKRVREAHIALPIGGYYRWKDIEPPFQNITRTILANQLTNLVIDGVEGFPFELLTSLADLTSLHLGQGTLLWIDSTAERAKVPWTLQVLSYESYSRNSTLFELFPTYHNAICARLHTLELKISDGKGHLPAWDLIQRMGASAESMLETLTLAYGVSSSDAIRKFQCASGSCEALLSDGRSLPPFPRLRHIDITIDAGFNIFREVGRSMLVPTCAPRIFCAMFRKAHLPSLSALDLTVSWEVLEGVWESVDLDHCRLVDRELGWGEVDEILSNQRLLPRLQYLSVVIGHADVSMAESGQDGVPLWVKVARCIKSQTIDALRKTVRRGLREFVVDDPDDEDWLSEEEEDSDFDGDGNE